MTYGKTVCVGKLLHVTFTHEGKDWPLAMNAEGHLSLRESVPEKQSKAFIKALQDWEDEVEGERMRKLWWEKLQRHLASLDEGATLPE